MSSLGVNDVIVALHDIGKLAWAICAMVDVEFLEFCCPLVTLRYQVHRIVNKGLKKVVNERKLKIG